jgi:hypothetical protein
MDIFIGISVDFLIVKDTRVYSTHVVMKAGLTQVTLQIQM